MEEIFFFFFFLRKNEQEKYWREVCILTLWTVHRSLWGDGIFFSERRRLTADNSRPVLISFCSRFARRPIMWQTFYSCPCFVWDGQHVSQSFFHLFIYFFCIFPLWPHEHDGAQKKAADVNKIFICQKDIQLNITTFHFKNQLDSSKSCSRRGGKKKPTNARRPLAVNRIISWVAKIMSPQMRHIFAWEIKPICGNGGLGLREHGVACKDEWYLAQHEENERCSAWCLAQMKALISGAKIKMTERRRLQLGLCYW